MRILILVAFCDISSLVAYLMSNAISSYSRYHTITDGCTTALLPTKPSSDDDSGFKYGFGAEASLPLVQSDPAVSHDTTRLCQIVVSLWDCHIHADALMALSCIYIYIYIYI